MPRSTLFFDESTIHSPPSQICANASQAKVIDYDPSYEAMYPDAARSVAQPGGVPAPPPLTDSERYQSMPQSLTLREWGRDAGRQARRDRNLAQAQQWQDASNAYQMNQLNDRQQQNMAFQNNPAYSSAAATTYLPMGR